MSKTQSLMIIALFFLLSSSLMYFSTSDKMKFVIPDVNVKTTGKVIHSLAKIGDEIYLEPSLDGLTLRSVNLSRFGCQMKILDLLFIFSLHFRSAFAQFSFGSSFFSSIEQDAEDNPGNENCKVKVPLEDNMYYIIYLYR